VSLSNDSFYFHLGITREIQRIRHEKPRIAIARSKGSAGTVTAPACPFTLSSAFDTVAALAIFPPDASSSFPPETVVAPV